MMLWFGLSLSDYASAGVRFMDAATAGVFVGVDGLLKATFAVALVGVRFCCFRKFVVARNAFHFTAPFIFLLDSML